MALFLSAQADEQVLNQTQRVKAQTATGDQISGSQMLAIGDQTLVFSGGEQRLAVNEAASGQTIALGDGDQRLAVNEAGSDQIASDQTQAIGDQAAASDLNRSDAQKLGEILITDERGGLLLLVAL
jgi:hypothetical protein